MTKNRDIPADMAETQRLLALVGSGPFKHLDYESWLGHTDGAGLADVLLLMGATMEQLCIARPNSFEDHRYHLKTEHGLHVTECEGIFKLALSAE